MPFQQSQLLRSTIQGPFTLAKTKIQKTWVFKPGFFVVPFTLPEKPITFGGFGTKSACAKKTWISYLCFGKWCAWATSLYLWPYTCSAHYVAGRGRVIPLMVTYHVTKNQNNTSEIGASVYIGKNQWNFGGVSKNHAAEVGFSIRVFWSVRGSCQRKTRMRERFGFFMPV